MTTDHAVPQSTNHHGKITAVVLIYALFSGFWILSSDRLLELLISDPQQIIQINMIKGMAYVAITSLLLYLLLTRWLDAGNTPQFANSGVSKLRKSILWVLVSATVVLTLVGIASNVEHYRTDVITRLQVLADHKAQLIADWLQERQADVEYLQGSEFITDNYLRWQRQGDSGSGQQLQHRLRQFCKCPGPNGVSLIDEQGQRIWNSEGAPTAMADELAKAVEVAGQNGKIQRIGPYRDGVERMLLDFAVPIAASDPGFKRSPVVVFHIELTHWLFPRLQMWPAGYASAGTLLLRRDGDRVRYLASLREGEDIAIDAPPRGNVPQLLDARIFSDDAKVIEDIDYRNMPIVEVAKNINGTDWYLVDKIDTEEIYNKARHEMVWVGLVGVLALFVLVGGYHLLERMQQLTIAQATQTAQSERLRALNLLEVIIDSSEDAIYAKDLQGRYIMFNRAASRFVGKPIEDVLGQNDTVIFPAEQAERVMSSSRRILAENRAITEEEYLDTTAGAGVFLSTKGPLRDEHGKVTGIFGISRDITERKKAEMALQESESRFRALVEQSLAGIYIIQDGCFRYVNPCFAAIFGYSEPAAIIDKVFVAELVSDEDRERVMENIRRCVAREVSDLRYAFKGLRRDGSMVPVEVHGRAFDYRNQPAVIGFVLDASEQVAAEQALQRQAQELVRRNQELESFNRAMVGRELDMVALKRQVNELSRQLGLVPPYHLEFLEGESWPEKD